MLDQFIRERIWHAREGRGMSQEGLAEYIYKSRVAMSDIERGRVQVSASDLALIAAVLEKPVSYFYPPNHRGVEEGHLSPEEKELIHFYRQIQDNTHKAFAVQQVHSIVDVERREDLEELRNEYEAYKHPDRPEDPQ